MSNTDFELQRARMAVLHSERDDLGVDRAALLARSDSLLELRKALLAEMRAFSNGKRIRVPAMRLIANDHVPLNAAPPTKRSTP